MVESQGIAECRLQSEFDRGLGSCDYSLGFIARYRDLHCHSVLGLYVVRRIAQATIFGGKSAKRTNENSPAKVTEPRPVGVASGARNVSYEEGVIGFRTRSDRNLI